MMDEDLFSDHFVGNLELIVVIKIVFLNNQKGIFEITLPCKTSKNIIEVRQIQNSKFLISAVINNSGMSFSNQLQFGIVASVPSNL